MTLERRKLKRSIPSLQNLDQDLFYDIKRIFVFGREGDAGFFITKNDYVYAYGKNSCGMLGLGIFEPVPESDPQQVTALTRRKITEFAAGRSHVLALSKSGRVFSCGSNEYGQLGLPEYAEVSVPFEIESLRKDKVVAIACGAFHSLVLTSRGILYGFGFNFWGQLGVGGRNENHFEPVCIASLRNVNIIEIVCGQHHSVALSRKGDLYTWGHNHAGQLGIGEKVNYRNIPTKVIHSEEFKIKSVTCGQNHVLAVSTDGVLLGFGSNYYGQLGVGSRRNEAIPVTICEDRKIKDVLSSPFSNTSLARTKKKRDSLIFGKCGDHWLLSPMSNPDPESAKNNNSEAFIKVNHMTAKSAVVKSHKNRWWYILNFVKNKIL